MCAQWSIQIFIGGFDETMFIDFVDFDFCYRLKKEGYEILQTPSVIQMVSFHV